jgi:hypothetical protein
MKKLLLFLGILVYANTIVYAQNKTNIPLSADSLATGNYKDVLGSFFQLAFNKFTSPQKEIKFSSNPFAVMAKLDTSLLKSREYYKYRHLRDLNFTFSARLDSSYKFNGFTSGLKYAIVNKRDETVSATFVRNVLDDPTVHDQFALNLELEAYISTFSDNIVRQDSLRAQKNRFFNGDNKFNQLDSGLKEKIKTIVKEKKLDYLAIIIKSDPQFNWKETSDKVYERIKSKINNRALWTVGITDTTYNDKFLFSNIVLSSEYVKGIDTMKSKDIELNIKAAVQFVDDSLITGRDLKRSVFSFEPGFNFVIKTRNTLKSYFEFKLSGSYYHTFSSLYKNEKRDSLTINGTIRVRIYNDIWVPLEIKYDPKNGNFFGFLNVRANFTALGKMAKSLVN